MKTLNIVIKNSYIALSISKIALFLELCWTIINVICIGRLY